MIADRREQRGPTVEEVVVVLVVVVVVVVVTEGRRDWSLDAWRLLPGNYCETGLWIMFRRYD